MIDFLSRIGWSYVKLEEEGIVSPVRLKKEYPGFYEALAGNEV